MVGPSSRWVRPYFDPDEPEFYTIVDEWYDPLESYSFGTEQAQRRSLFPNHDHSECDDDLGMYHDRVPKSRSMKDPKTQLEECCLQSGSTVNIAQDGDLYLSLQEIRVRVASKVLRKASSFFAAMLDSPFSEGKLELNTKNPPSLPLLDDNVDTVVRLCRILHGRYHLSKDAMFFARKSLRSAYDCWGDGHSNCRGPCRCDSDWPAACKALADLTQLSHKWNCFAITGSLISRIRRYLVEYDGLWSGVGFSFEIGEGWTRYHDVSLAFFAEDAQLFREATAHMMVRLNDGQDVGLPHNKPKPDDMAVMADISGISSFYNWPDIAIEEDFRELFTDAVTAGCDRLLSELQAVIDLFQAETEAWFVCPEGRVTSCGPDDCQWRSRGPPDLLQDFAQHWDESPYIDDIAFQSDYYDYDFDRQPVLLDMIRTVERLNEGEREDNKPPGRKACDVHRDKCHFPRNEMPKGIKTKGWRHHGLYLRSDDKSETVLYFTDCVKAAIDSACASLDGGICLHYFRTNQIHAVDTCKSYPCWTQDAETADLDTLWKPWDWDPPSVPTRNWF